MLAVEYVKHETASSTCLLLELYERGFGFYHDSLMYLILYKGYRYSVWHLSSRWGMINDNKSSRINTLVNPSRQGHADHMSTRHSLLSPQSRTCINSLDIIIHNKWNMTFVDITDNDIELQGNHNYSWWSYGHYLNHIYDNSWQYLSINNPADAGVY